MHPEQAELAEFGDQLAGERSGLEPVGDVRHDPVGRELAHGVADEALLVAQLVVDPQQVAADGFRGARHGSVLSVFLRPAYACGRCWRSPALPVAQPGLAGGVGPGGVRNNVFMSYTNGSGKVLVRRRDNRIVAGVCAGLADYAGMDVNLLRVLVALVSLFTGGAGVIAYIVGWIVIPEEGQKTSIAEDLVNKNRQG